MYNTVRGEAVFFVACIATGLAIAFLYDLIRLSRRLVNVRRATWINGQDILFLGVAAVILFGTAFFKNSGEIRWQGFLGTATGIFLYAFCVRNRFVNLGETVVKWLVKALLRVLKILTFPIVLVLRALKKPVHIIAWYTGRALRRARRVAKCQGARAKMRVLSAISLRRKK